MLANFTRLRLNLSSPWLWVLISALAVAARLAFAFLGNNFDVESYWIVGQAVSAGENVYAATHRYNYGPIWFVIVGLIYQVSTSFLVFRILIAGFLTLVDLAIAKVLHKEFGGAVAIAFLLNPISIFITGYHSQFDNLSILFGLLGVSLLAGGFTWRGKKSWAGVLLIGISLITKHIFFLFPFWLALKQKGFLNKLVVAAVPVVLFLSSFLPFWAEGSEGIKNNVFLYRSFNNAPFWTGWAPGLINNNIPLFLLFVGTLALLGLLLRKKNTKESLILYLVALVLFSSSVANQYVAITVPFLALYWRNALTHLYSLVTFAYLLADPAAGLGLIPNTDSLVFRVLAFNVQAGVLFAAFISALYPERFKTLFHTIGNWFKREVLWQWRSIVGNPRD